MFADDEQDHPLQPPMGFVSSLVVGIVLLSLFAWRKVIDVVQRSH